MKLIIIVLFICVGFFANAQTPGYLGKKFIIQVGVGSMPNLNGSLVSEISGIDKMNLPDDYKKLNMNMSYNASIGFAISRKSNIVFEYTLKTKDHFFPFFTFTQLNNDNTYSGSIYYVDGNMAKLVSQKYSVGIQKYVGGGIAPVGKYFEYGLTINMTKISEDDKLYQGESYRRSGGGYDNNWAYAYEVENEKELTTVKPVRLSSIYLAMGKRRVFNNNLFIDLRIKGQLPLSFKHLRGYSADLVYEESTLIKGKYYDETHYDIFASNYFKNYKEGQTYYDDRIRKFQYLNELIEAKISVGILF